MIAEGTPAELKAQTGAPGSRSRSPSPIPPRPTRSRRWSTGAVTSATTAAACARRRTTDPAWRPSVVRALDAVGVAVDEVAVHRPSLDDVFFALTGQRPRRPTRPTSAELERRPASVTHRPTREPSRSRDAPGVAGRLRDAAVLTRRNLVHVAREPAQLSDVTVQPVLFTLLFVHVFGAGVVLPGGGCYADFAIGGLLALNLTTSAMGTAVGLSTDLSTGLIDRFRTLPMRRSAVSSAGRSPICCRRAVRRVRRRWPGSSSAGGPTAACSARSAASAWPCSSATR